MIASTEHKDYQKLLKDGKGSILKAIRSDKGGGKGLIAGGLVLIGAGVLLSMFGGLLYFGIPGLVLLLIGIPLKRKRESAWINYYKEQTGFSEGEITRLDRELASPSVKLVTTSGAAANHIACFFTEHYMVMNGMSPYVRRLEDFIAAAFSDSSDTWSMSCLTAADSDTRSVPLLTDTDKKSALCEEIMEELCRRNPKVLRGQEISCDGRTYILERDGAEILRLYREGRELQSAV